MRLRYNYINYYEVKINEWRDRNARIAPIDVPDLSSRYLFYSFRNDNVVTYYNNHIIVVMKKHTSHYWINVC